MSKKTMNLAETNRLLELCTKNKHILECKKTDMANNKIKDECWEKITKEFNLENEIPRDMKVLKTKYKNLKFATKAKTAAQRQSMYGTGGGPATTSTMSVLEDKMLGILNKAEVVGIHSAFDSDGVGFEKPTVTFSDEIELEEIAVDEDVFDEMPKDDVAISAPKPGPATLRTKISAQLRTSGKKDKQSSWDKLAAVKCKWSEDKLKAEVDLAKKMVEQVDLQMKHMEEKHQLELEHARLQNQRLQEKHQKEMEILNSRL